MRFEMVSFRRRRRAAAREAAEEKAEEEQKESEEPEVDADGELLKPNRDATITEPSVAAAPAEEEEVEPRHRRSSSVDSLMSVQRPPRPFPNMFD